MKVQEVTAISPKTSNAHDFFVLDTVDWVNVLPITADQEVVFVRQYRHGSDALSLEIPGGMVDPGEAPIVSAARECLEESGFRASHLTSLGVLNPNPAVFNNQLHTFVAENVVIEGDIQNTATEQTEVVLVPKAELTSYLLDGRIDHALVAATLWRYLYLNQS
ncbi:MAG: NUDIX hydrolase [Pseudomonadales bacterium]|jgi:8-oxo-dGTP pyrophosphatase MutT (NUDIX family)|nr:NUDIX hydrolase [Pseudomonadales bacterium]